MVSEYKMKVQMAEAENTRLEGTVSNISQDRFFFVSACVIVFI